ncbi:unnamed protein product [Rotaria sp. Silwood1]|nr:unnamed protein product [Rotaria sp. Silwood1]
MSYLTPAENLYSFFDINDKLCCNNLLREQRYSIDICNLTTFVPSSIFRYLCANVFPYISQYAKSLMINAVSVGSRVVHEIPCILYSNLESLYLNSLQVYL